MKRENPTIEICPGITRRTVAHGNTMYQMLATLAAGSKMPAHSHPQEQIVHILEGKMRLIVEGVPHELSTGDSFYLASNVPHGVETLSATRVLDTFSPPRTIIWQSTKRFSTARCNCSGSTKQPSKTGGLSFRLVCNPQHNFSARVMSRGLLLRLYRISQRKNFCHDWFDFPSIDQLRDLCEIFGIRMRGNTRAADSMFLEAPPDPDAQPAT